MLRDQASPRRASLRDPSTADRLRQSARRLVHKLERAIQDPRRRDVYTTHPERARLLAREEPESIDPPTA